MAGKALKIRRNKTKQWRKGNAASTPSVLAGRKFSTRTKASIKADFEKVLPVIIDEVVVGNPDIKDLPIIQSWFRKMFEYNLVGGKMTRGLQVVDSYYQMTDPVKVNQQDLFIAQIVGWCTEMMLTQSLVSDDMMDESVTRRGQPCWYRVDNVGTWAVNDALLIEATIFDTLKQYVSDKPYYMDLVRLFEDILYKVFLGQCVDMHSYVTDGKTDFSKVTLEQVGEIARYKTAYMTVYLPTISAMHIVGLGKPEYIASIENILLDIGIYFQAQDDYIDCFYDASQTGKYGTDIEDGKCTWVLATALENGTPEQIVAIRKHYGIKDGVSISNVKKIYREIGIPEVYKKYEQDIQTRLREEVDQLPTEIPRGPFLTMLNKLQGRGK